MPPIAAEGKHCSSSDNCCATFGCAGLPQKCVDKNSKAGSGTSPARIYTRFSNTSCWLASGRSRSPLQSWVHVLMQLRTPRYSLSKLQRQWSVPGTVDGVWQDKTVRAIAWAKTSSGPRAYLRGNAPQAKSLARMVLCEAHAGAAAKVGAKCKGFSSSISFRALNLSQQDDSC